MIVRTAPTRIVDLGPTPWTPLHGHATLRGHAVVPAPTTYRPEDATAAERLRAFRARRKAAA